MWDSLLIIYAGSGGYPPDSFFVNKMNLLQTKKNNLIYDGTFEMDNNEEDCNVFYPFLEKFFLLLQRECNEEWNKEDCENGMITMNRGIQAVIRVLDDVVAMLTQKGMIFPKKQSPDDILSLISYYFQPLFEYLNKKAFELQLIQFHKYYKEYINDFFSCFYMKRRLIESIKTTVVQKKEDESNRKKKKVKKSKTRSFFKK